MTMGQSPEDLFREPPRSATDVEHQLVSRERELFEDRGAPIELWRRNLVIRVGIPLAHGLNCTLRRRAQYRHGMKRHSVGFIFLAISVLLQSARSGPVNAGANDAQSTNELVWGGD